MRHRFDKKCSTEYSCYTCRDLHNLPAVVGGFDFEGDVRTLFRDTQGSTWLSANVQFKMENVAQKFAQTEAPNAWWGREFKSPPLGNIVNSYFGVNPAHPLNENEWKLER